MNELHIVLLTIDEITLLNLNATRSELTLGIGFLVCSGDFTAGGGGLDGGAGRGGGCPNLVPTSGPSAILTGSPKISSSGLLTSKQPNKQSDINK